MQAVSPESIKKYWKLLGHFNDFESLTSTHKRPVIFLNVAKMLISVFWLISFKSLLFQRVLCTWDLQLQVPLRKQQLI